MELKTTLISSFFGNLWTILTRAFAWKRKESTGDRNRDSDLLRFFGQSPSFLDDPDDIETFTQRARKAFGPREVDAGKPSYWEASCNLQCLRLAAQHAARQKKAARLTILSIPATLVRAKGFVINHERDDQAFECLAELHRTINMKTPDVLDKFIELLRMQLTEAHDDKGPAICRVMIRHQTISKDDVLETIREAVVGCQNVDISGEQTWAQQAARDTDT